MSVLYVKSIKCIITKTETPAFVLCCVQNYWMFTIRFYSPLSCMDVNRRIKVSGSVEVKSSVSSTGRQQSTPETCPHRAGFLLSAFVMEKDTVLASDTTECLFKGKQFFFFTTSAGDALHCKRDSREEQGGHVQTTEELQ